MSRAKKDTLQELENKINFSVVNKEDFNKSTITKVTKILKPLSPSNVEGFVWNLNWSDTKKLGNPSGFSLSLKESSPVVHKVFPYSKMFQATIAFLVDPNEFKFNDGSQVNLENVIKRLEKIEDGLNSSSIHEMHDSKAISMKFYEPNSLIDISSFMGKKEIEPVMGISGSFAGVYTSSDRRSYIPRNNIWLAAQVNCPTVSMDFNRLAEEKEGSDTTLLNFLYSSPEVKYLRQAAITNRILLLNKMIDSIGLVSSKGKSVIHPTIETESHGITRNIATKSIIYHSGTVDPSTIRSGLLFCHNPYLGVSILNGPHDDDLPFGSHWEASQKSYSAFPVNTGRIATESDVNGSHSQISSEEKKVLTWSRKKSNPNGTWRLAKGVYRIRDNKFKKGQEYLGYNKSWGEIDLQPIMVRVNTSDD